MLGRAGRGIAVGLVLSGSFSAIFIIAGLAVTAGLRSVLQVLPWVAFAVGLCLVGLGAVMLSGRQVRLLPALRKFARCRWTEGPSGTPLLVDCGNWFAARILERMRGGDHWGFLLDPFEAASDSGERPFNFHRAKRLEPGHSA